MAITRITLTANGDTPEHKYDATLSENDGFHFHCSGTFATSDITLSFLGADGNFHIYENGGPFTALADKEVREKTTKTVKATMAGATGGESVYVEIADLARG